MSARLRIGIIGAGLNADYHINFSKTYAAGEIVGVADADLGRARDCARRHGLPVAFGSAGELLRETAPDVVHVVTPPTTHFAVAGEVLEAGRHALVEKPLAINWKEANALYGLAERQHVQLCPMHNHLFDPCMRRAAELIDSGALGTVVNVESYYGINTQIPAFREYPRPNVLPWLYGLPGGVYQDFLPHPLYLLLEYTGAPRALSVMHRATGVLPQDLPDEIRILVDGERSFGTLTFSFAARPHLHFVRVYGTKMMIEVDFNTMTTVVHPVSSLPKAAQKATYNLRDSWQRTRTTVSNVSRFVTGKLKPYQGMKTLIHGFYDAVRSDGLAPISKDSALLVIKTMDAVFERLTFEPLKHETIAARTPPARQPGSRILVTGGTGFLGKRLVRRLVANGHTVRVLARKLARVKPLEELGVEVCWGDVADLDSFDRAVDGCGIVIHLAAGTSGSEKDSERGTLQGTRNLIELCRRHKPKKLIYISSCGVYGIAECRKNAQVSEDGPLEPFPERRGSYSASKQEAERYIADYMKSADVPIVILRPGTIYGPGGDLYTPMMGFSLGRLYVVIGSGRFVLPFVYVENLVDAIVAAMEKKEAEGQIFNVVDTERLNKQEYMNRVIRRVRPDARIVYLPYSLLYGITWLQEIAFRLMRREPVLSRYRLASSQKMVVYDASKIGARLGWTPSVPTAEALDRLVNSELSAHNVRS